ncbi:6962_t:CDS:2, partial [Funneliformis mosseae]
MFRRFDASSVIKDNIIYVLGGFNGGPIPEILFLDLTNSMTIGSPPWSQSLKPSPLAFSSSGAVLGGPNNNFIFSRKTMGDATQLNERTQFSIISDNNGNAYLHGGYNNGVFLGDTYFFDTISITWTMLLAPQIPIFADEFSSVLLNDGRLLIIRGYGPPENGVPVYRPISQ